MQVSAPIPACLEQLDRLIEDKLLPLEQADDDIRPWHGALLYHRVGALRQRAAQFRQAAALTAGVSARLQ